MKKLLTLLMCLVVGIGTAKAYYVTTSGNFSTGGSWRIEGSTLYIDAEVVPDYTGTHLGCGPWCRFTQLRKVQFSSKIRSIGNYAFWHAENINTVAFENKSQADVVIGYNAFEGCYNLVVFDGRYIKSILGGAFKNCYKLDKLVLPAVTNIGRDAFDYCARLFKATRGDSPSIWLTGNTLPVIEKQDFSWYDGGGRKITYWSTWIHEDGTHGPEKSISVNPGSYMIFGVTNPSLLSSLQSTLNSYSDWFYCVIGGKLYDSDANLTYYWCLMQNMLVSGKNDPSRLVVHCSGNMDDYASASATPWNDYRSQIKSINIYGSKTTYIGKNAFNGLSNVKDIFIEEGEVNPTTKITRIGESAFANCSNLGNIGFIQHTQEIGKNAFANCTKVYSNLNIPAATTIGDAAFDGCHFKEITFGSSLSNIGQYAFRGSFADGGSIYTHSAVPTTHSTAFDGVNSSKTYLYVKFEHETGYQTTAPWNSFLFKTAVDPVITGTWGLGYGIWRLTTDDGILLVGTTNANWDSKVPAYKDAQDQPWYPYRRYIRRITLLDGVQNIGDNAFAYESEGESKITEVDIPASVTEIGENAFKNNDQIEEVVAEGVKNIGNQAFENCSSLEEVKLGDNVESLGEKVFNNCGLVDVMAVKSATPPAVTAQTFLGMGVVSSNAPAKVKAKYAARKAKAATGQKSVSLEVPDAHISKYLAAQYWNLFSFEYIGEHGGIVESDLAYDGLYVLYSDGTMIISASAPTDPQNINVGFTISSSAKSKVKRIEIQGTLEKLGHQFNDCPNLEEVVLSGGINSLNGTFNNCPKLKTINLENVQYLKSHQQGNKVIPCFGGCAALQEVNIPGVLEIGDNCFKGCTGLTKVTLGGEAEVGMEAFSGCTALKRVALGNAKLNGALQAFQGCTALEEMTYSGTRMPAEIFKGCTALHKINLGGSLKDILSEAFANTSIDSIYVQCPTPPEAAATAFSGINLSSIKVIVPDAFDGPYWSAPVWEDMFFYDDEDYAELDFPIHFAIGNNGFGTVDESGNLTINAMGALVDNFRDYVEPYAPYINGEIRIGNEVSSLPAGTPYRLPFGWVKEDGPRAIVLGSGLLELGDYALYNNVWDCDLIVDCYALNPPVMKGANVFNWSKIQNGSQCVATLNVVNDAAVEAAYRADTYWKKFSISSWLTPADAPAECTVTFVDWDGTILQQTTTRPGMMVTPPADPVREGYTFKGWDSQDYTWVVSDLTITATYYDETYTVRFYDWDGTLLSEQQVHYGQAAEAPADPAREGYTFLGWSEDFSTVTIDKYIVAMYHNDHEGIEDIQPDQVPNIKVMIDGVIYILRDGKIYNILGTEVR